MRFEVVYIDDTREEFADILRITLKKSTDTPAHSLAVRLPFIIEKEICEVRLLDERGLIFEGVVDEQILYFSESLSTEIIARSMEALLLDNEACPEVFTNPSSSLIFSRYARVCSLEKLDAPGMALKGVLKVYKGTSCYQVLKEFCERVYGKAPFVLGRKLCIADNEARKEILFSDKGEGVLCSKIERSFRRCDLISKVMVKTLSDGAYSKEICDEKSVASRVYRQRYTDVSDLDAVSLLKAQKILETGRKRAVAFEVTTKNRLLDSLGCSAAVSAGGREYNNLVVTDILYTLKDRKEETKITLSAKEE